MSRRLFLQPHVFLCRGKRYWVILDVDRDKYLCVDRRQFESLGPSLEGWKESTGSGEDSAAAGSSVTGALANDLLRLGILSEQAAGAKEALATTYPLPTAAFDPDLPAPSRGKSCLHAGTFFASFARACRELRRRRFQDIVQSVRARKARNAGRVDTSDLERTRALVAVFERLRLFYPRSYVCLLDSLALVHFLASYRVFPDWVFGVVADPFEAHCWAQAGDIVLNDTVERVSGFTPIMYV